MFEKMKKILKKILGKEEIPVEIVEKISEVKKVEIKDERFFNVEEMNRVLKKLKWDIIETGAMSLRVRYTIDGKSGYAVLDIVGDTVRSTNYEVDRIISKISGLTNSKK